jgi:heat shock protein HtpX
VPVAAPVIVPRRSVAFFAFLAVAMVVISYVVLLLMAAACVYFPFLLLTSVQNINVLFLFLGGVVVAGAILWSVFPRRDKFERPGLLLEREAHPRLFAELDAIAAALKEPVPREVYLVGQANAFVADRGGMLGFGSRRVMGIGLPLLSCLTVTEIRAVLAHEFAHYYSGDTRMGPWVYNTQTAMVRMFQNMGSLRGLARIAVLQFLYAMVFTILKWYFIFFLRVTNFVSRRKEYRADELACLVAGARPMAEGLRKIHGAGMAWVLYWSSQVVPALNEGCMPPIGDGFVRFLAAPEIAQQVADGLAKEIAEGKSQPYDTHPPLRDRIAAVEKVIGANADDDSASALSLLEQPQVAEWQLIAQLNPQLAASPLPQVDWDEYGTKVLIPSWRKRAAEYAGLLNGITVASLPDAVRKLPEIGSHMRDPKGMLLAPQQRAQRAGHMLAICLALAMVDSGWELNAQPGIFSLSRNGKKVHAIAKVHELFEGKLSASAWSALCEELGIGELSLVKGVEPTVSAP